MEYQTILLNIEDNIGIIKLNNTKKLNTLSQLFFDEFEDAINEVSINYELKALIICSSDKKVFCAGGELNEIAVADYDQALVMCLRVQNAFSALQNLEIPVIAALDGIVYGGGFELALHCDIRFATPNTIFRLPESDLGLIPGAGGSSIFSKYFPISEAAYYLFSGKEIPIEKALNRGLVQELFSSENLEYETLKFAKELSLKSSESIKTIKKILITSLNLPTNDLLEMEAKEFSSVLQISGKEKIKSFFELKKK